MNKAELIRHEIEKRRVHNLAIGNPLFSAMAEEDIELLCFIDSLQEEPVSDELEKVVEEIVDPTVLNAYGVKEIANRLRRTMIEPVSEDLEEASKEWLRPQLDKSYANYGEAKMMELTRFDGYAMLDAIEFGAKWQKEKDQDAVEIAKKEVIEETAEWLTKHAKKYYFNKDRYLGTNELVEDYKLIMSM